VKAFLETTDDDWQWLMGINFLGTVKSLRAFLPGLVAQGSGRVVVTSSVAALRELPMPAQSMYHFPRCRPHQSEG
jgi:NADP-dependent 3-hydroxy acid dehydrogenase YdfG